MTLFLMCIIGAVGLITVSILISNIIEGMAERHWIKQQKMKAVNGFTL